MSTFRRFSVPRYSGTLVTRRPGSTHVAARARRRVVDETYSAVGEEFFHGLARGLASALGVRYAMVAECLEGSSLEDVRVSTVAFWVGTGFGQNFHYALAGTPCAALLHHREAVCYADALGSLFPDDRYLADLGVESYCGAPLVAGSGETLGHVAVMDVGPMTDPAGVRRVVEAVAPRCTVEMSRRRAEREREFRLAELLEALRRPAPPRYLTVCAWCRKARTVDGVWTTFEQYVSQRDGTKSTHGICPECRAAHGVPPAP